MGNIVFENKKKKMQSQTTYSNFNFWVQEVFSKVRDFFFLQILKFRTLIFLCSLKRSLSIRKATLSIFH